MQLYDFNISTQVPGLHAPSASVQVNNYPSGTAATLYASNDTKGLTLTNPIIASVDGSYQFWAAAATYSFVITPVGGVAQTVPQPATVTYNSSNQATGVQSGGTALGLPLYTYDSLGNVIGFWGPSGNSIGLSKLGYKTVLFGDSMVDTFHTPVAPTSASYAPSTGVLTITYSGHQQATGWTVGYWNRHYPVTYALTFYTTTYIDSSNFSINIGANLTGYPTGAIVVNDGCFYRAQNWPAAESMFFWLNALSDQTFNLIANSGQSGDQTADSLARLQSQCLSLNPDVVIMQIPGINDLSHSVPLETIWTNQQNIINQICGVVQKLILINATPVASGEVRYTLHTMTAIMKLNRRLSQFVKTKSNVVLFDAHKLVVDPSNAVGGALTSMVRTNDFIHYSMNGGQKIAAALWAQISTLFPSSNSTLPSATTDSWSGGAVACSSVTSDGATPSTITVGVSTAHGYQNGEIVKVGGGSPAINDYGVINTATTNAFKVLLNSTTVAIGSVTGTVTVGASNNLFDNPVFNTATGGTLAGGVTGTAANHVKAQILAGSPTVVSSVTARSDGIGNDQILTITSALAGNQCNIEADFALAATLWPTIVTAGNTYIFEGSLTLTGISGSNLTEIRPVLMATVGGVVYQSYAMFGYSSGTDLTQDVANIHFQTNPMILPAGSCTNFKWAVYFLFSAAGSAVVAKLGKVALYEYLPNGTDI